MSRPVVCDGPGCKMQRDPSYEERMVCEVGWTHVEQAGQEFDFHDTDCLVKWAGGAVTAVDLTELRRAWNDETPGTLNPQRVLVREFPRLSLAIQNLLAPRSGNPLVRTHTPV